MRSDHPVWKTIRTGNMDCPLCGRPLLALEQDDQVLPVHRTPSYRMCFREPITIAQARQLRRFRLRAHP